MEIVLSEPDKPADFFLTTDCRGDLATPRKCWCVARLRDRTRDDYMLIEIHPAVIGQRYGLGDEDIFFVLLAAKWRGYSLFPVSHWPCPVNVYRVLDERVLGASSFEPEQVTLMAWGTIFPTLAEANASAAAQRGP